MLRVAPFTTSPLKGVSHIKANTHRYICILRFLYFTYSLKLYSHLCRYLSYVYTNTRFFCKTQNTNATLLKVVSLDWGLMFSYEYCTLKEKKRYQLHPDSSKGTISCKLCHSRLILENK